MAKKGAKKTSNAKAKVSSKKEIKDTPKVSSTPEKYDIDVFKILKKLTPIFLILIVMWFAFYVRTGPVDLDGLDDMIKANTYSQIKNIITQQVSAEYPNLPQNYKQEEIDRRYQKVADTGEFELNGQVINIDDLAAQNAQGAKQAFKAENNQTYLNAIDPYHFMRYSELYSTNGYGGDKLVDGKPVLSYKLAPNGIEGGDSVEFHVKLESFLFKLNGLDSSSDVGEKTKAIYLIPVIFVLLSVIPIFLVIRKYSNDLFAFFGSLLLVSIGIFVSRTVAGFVDTDSYNVFFPLVIVAFLVYSFSYKQKWLSILLAVLAGFSQAMFLFAWGNGWFMFLFSTAALLGYFVYILITSLSFDTSDNKSSNRLYLNDILTLVSYVISSFIFTLVLIGQNIFTMVYWGLMNGISGIVSISQTNIWPNVLSSVAELNAAPFSSIIDNIGGRLVFFIAMMGVLFLTIDFKSNKDKINVSKLFLTIFSAIWFILIINGKFDNLTANSKLLFLFLTFLPVLFGMVLSMLSNNRSEKIFVAGLLSAWMGGTIFMSLNGTRFILLLAPAFAIAFGIGLYEFSKIINNFFSKELNLTNKIAKVAPGFVIMSLVFLLLFSVVPGSSGRTMSAGAIAISKGTLPNFDDAWYSSMEKIKENSNEDAIITSWWDFGHFFSAVAQRGVTFDGGTQGTPRAHWVGKLLLEEDEEVSHDILQMLVCGGNNAFDRIFEFSEDKTNGVQSVELIYSTLGKSDDEKIEILEDNGFNQEQVEVIMDELACSNPAENFLITSGDMVGKAPVWAHWGSWDFTKKYTHDNYKTKSATQIATDLDKEEELIQTYVNELKAIDVRATNESIKREDLMNQWFSKYPSYRGQKQCAMNNNTIYCGVVMDSYGRVFVDDYRGFSGCQKDTLGNAFCSFSINDQGEIGGGTPLDDLFTNVYVASANGLEKIEQNTTQGILDVVLLPSGDGRVSYMLTDSPLGGSLFTKLFYLEGYGSKYFEKFDDVQSATGVRVITWKVKWDNEVEGDLSGVSLGSVSFNATAKEVEELLNS